MIELEKYDRTEPKNYYTFHIHKITCDRVWRGGFYGC